MKTIEERAEEYANKMLIGYERELWLYNTREEIKKVFIDSAEEQKKIDDANLHKRFEKVLNGQKWDLIDEACKWLSDYFVFKHEAMSAQGCDAFLHEFRKAMGDRYVE